MDERLKWLEQRITSSLKCRSDDVRNMHEDTQNKLAFHEFLSKEDVKTLFVTTDLSRRVIVKVQPPSDIQRKSLFFYKHSSTSRVTAENIDSEVSFMDCSGIILHHLLEMTKQVYFPLVSLNDNLTKDTSVENRTRLNEVLHRLISNIQVTQGHIKGKIVLNLPSMEVLLQLSSTENNEVTMIHMFETVVISWIKQIKSVLNHDPIKKLLSDFPPNAVPTDERDMWIDHLDNMKAILDQITSPVHQDILSMLKSSNSVYWTSFTSIQNELEQAVYPIEENLLYLSTLISWYEKLELLGSCAEIVDILPAINRLMMLIWEKSKYYHQRQNFQHLLALLSNGVVKKAFSLVGDNVLRDPLQSHLKIKEALRVCAAFRGSYLDWKAKADDLNSVRLKQNTHLMLQKPKKGTLFTSKLYGPLAFVPKYGSNSRKKSDDNNNQPTMSSEAADANAMWIDSPWPLRNAPCFDYLNSFMERCNDVLELVQTTRHWESLRETTIHAGGGGAGNPSLDALIIDIHNQYSIAIDNFFAKVPNLLDLNLQAFEPAFFQFRNVIRRLEDRLSGILRMSFTQCPTISSKLRHLDVFEGICCRDRIACMIIDTQMSETHVLSKDSLLAALQKVLLTCKNLRSELD